MERSLLPPRGVFVPTALIYDRPNGRLRLTASLLQTWIQLRGLAWGRSETPPLHIDQLSSLLGKSPSAIYAHLTFLRTDGALRWRSLGGGVIVVMFGPADSSGGSPAPDPTPATPAPPGGAPSFPNPGIRNESLGIPESNNPEIRKIEQIALSLTRIN